MSRRTRFYLDSRNGKLFGVCAGIGDYLGINPIWVRITAVGVTVLGGGFITIPGYILALVVASKKPAELYDEPLATQHFWRDVRTAPGRTIRDTRARFRDIDRRLSDVEAYVTSSNHRLASEIDKLR
jgi:phage shock protein C